LLQHYLIFHNYLACESFSLGIFTSVAHLLDSQIGSRDLQSQQAESGMTLLARLRWRATHQPEQIAYQFLADQPLPVAQSALTRWTYGQLYSRVQVIAAAIEQQLELANRSVEQPVLLVYPPGLELIAAFLGCLAVGVIAIPVPPPRRHESLARWQHIMADAKAMGIVSTQSLLGDMEPLLCSPPAAGNTNNIRWLATDTISANTAQPNLAQPSTLQLACDGQLSSTNFSERFPSPEKVAFLQYTSGSTSQPKGVMVTHANLAHNLQQIQQAFGHSADTRCVIWLPPYHDMGLIGGILQPLYGGYPVTLMSPSAFLRQPFRWLEAISHFGGTTSGGPNFAYDYCVQKVSPEQCQNLDLTTWKVAFTGAEPVRAQTLERFTKAFARCGFQREAFYPCYGLAEATLLVSGGTPSEAPNVISVSSTDLAQGRVKPVETSATEAVRFVSCGRPVNQRVEIVDPHTGIACLPDQVGEIWVAGESVTAGYWNRVSVTQKTFKKSLIDQSALQTMSSLSDQSSAQQKVTAKALRSPSFMKTGDLGFFHSGELFITGRLKDLIVIRGQNYYPQDIEITASQAHSSLLPAGAAFSLDSNEVLADDRQSEMSPHEEMLIIVQEISRSAVRAIRHKTLRIEDIATAIRSDISRQYGLQVWAIALLKPGHLPKTTSGKVQRQACKAQFIAGTLASVGQWPEPKEISARSFAKSSTRSTIDISTSDITSDISTSNPTDLRDPSTTNSDAKRSSATKTEQLLGWLRQYASESINSRLMDERRSLSPGIVLDFGNQGLLGMQVPHPYGGLALGHQDMLRVIAQLGAIDSTLALFVGLNNVLGIRPILHYAQSELKAQLLPKLATGRELAAFALTEAAAGSHPFGIRSQAVPTAAGWLLNGEKIWSGSASWAGVINVFVQQVDGSGRPLGISGFALRKGTPGLRQGPEALTMGMRGMVQNTVLLDHVLVDDAQRLGEAGQGMTVAQDAMMYGRLAIAAASLGGMKRCAQLVLRYSQRRTISTGQLLDNPVTLTRLGALTSAIAALESLVNLTATRLDQHLPVPEELYAACKIIGPEFYWQATDHLIQCLGGRGYIETNLAPQMMRDARVLRIFEGPTEALAMYLGARVLQQPEALRQFFMDLDSLKPPEADTRANNRTGEQLFEAAHSISTQYLSQSFSENSPFSDPLTAQRQTNFVVGNIAAWAILLIAAETSHAPPATLAWVRQTFEQAIAQALQPQLHEAAAVSAGALAKQIERYRQSIGEVEQTLAGTDETLDEWLALEKPTPPVFTAFSPATPSQKEQPSSAEPSHKSLLKQTLALENWMIQWLSARLNISAAQIDSTKAFADYGLDSVMAVELAQDLGDFLQLADPLEVTLAWNFPNIQALASHLATMPSNLSRSKATPLTEGSSEGSAEPAVERPDRENALADLTDLSEAEAADLLAAELATVRGINP
jgi:acyl-CoA synthetase (AMP-forming)/AMP-acid ligase II/alkylation response protein AidB-like acyl-CoA dehydrogenase/acyl carrier protein